jgi:hypothetical protein
MYVLAVHCRHCGAEVQIQIADGDEKTFAEKLAEVEAMAEKAHACAKGAVSR